MNIKTLRGGSWRDLPDYCRSAYRKSINPHGNRINHFSFRLIIKEKKE